MNQKPAFYHHEGNKSSYDTVTAAPADSHLFQPSSRSLTHSQHPEILSLVKKLFTAIRELPP